MSACNKCEQPALFEGITLQDWETARNRSLSIPDKEPLCDQHGTVLGEPGSAICSLSRPPGWDGRMDMSGNTMEPCMETAVIKWKAGGTVRPVELLCRPHTDLMADMVSDAELVGYGFEPLRDPRPCPHDAHAFRSDRVGEVCSVCGIAFTYP